MNKKIDVDSIRPNDVSAYLRAQGWIFAPGISSKTEILHHPLDNTSRYELLLPRDRVLRDFAERMRELLVAVSEFEERSVQELVKDINLFAQEDIIRIHGYHPSLEQGNIPVANGMNFYQQTYRMLLAAACSAVTVQSSYPDKPERAQRYLENEVFLTVAQVGYTVVLNSPLASLNEPRNANLGIPFPRMVLLKLSEGLKAVKEISETLLRDDDDSVELFIDNLDRGISSNLCKALAGINSSLDEQSFEVSFSLAHAYPEPRLATQSVEFTPSIMPILRKAGDVLTKMPLSKGEIIAGKVISLIREFAGSGVISVRKDSRQVISMLLNPQQYPLAIQAHASQAVISCRGDLIQTSSGYFLQNVHDFTIEP